jgi:hypothetical protein
LRKPLIGALVGAFVLVIAAVAFAQVQNTYTVSGSVSPTKAGTKKKPVPVGLKFNYEVGEQGGQRPAVEIAYAIQIDGLQQNGAFFPKCTAAQINAANSDSSCPSSAKVGSGNVENIAGSSSNPADKSQTCHLDLTEYNGGKGLLTLYLSGGAPTCPLSISQAIQARVIKNSRGIAIRFSVPPSLAHPIPGFDNSVVQTTTSLSKKKAKGRGYLESVGGCKGGKRAISVTFTPETGSPVTESTASSCSA